MFSSLLIWNVPDVQTHLVVVEDGVGHGVFSWYSVGPQLLHKENLIGERRHCTYTQRPVGDVTAATNQSEETYNSKVKGTSTFTSPTSPIKLFLQFYCLSDNNIRHESLLLPKPPRSTQGQTKSRAFSLGSLGNAVYPLWGHINLFTVFSESGFFDPVGQVPHKIEEEVAVGDADDLHISHKPREWKRILRTRG